MSELQNFIDLYNQDNSEENRNNLIDLILSIDKDNINEYYNKLKENVEKKLDIFFEQQRLDKIISCMDDIISKRKELENINNDYNLEIVFNDIPNISKYNSLNNEKIVVDGIINILNKLDENNIGRAKEIFKRKEFKYILFQYNLISDDSDIEIDNYLDSKLSDKIEEISNEEERIEDDVQDEENILEEDDYSDSEDSSDENKVELLVNGESNLRLLKTFYEERDNFKDLVIPTMGLVDNSIYVNVDNDVIFNK